MIIRFLTCSQLNQISSELSIKKKTIPELWTELPFNCGQKKDTLKSALFWSHGPQNFPILLSRRREPESALRSAPFPLKTQFRKILFANLFESFRESGFPPRHSPLRDYWDQRLAGNSAISSNTFTKIS